MKHNRPARPTRRRRAGALLSAAALVAGLTTFIAAEAPASATDGTSAAFDLSAPTAGISDPAASLTPLARDCAQGQVDINSATTTAIGAAIGVSSQPTLNRIVAARPWLRAVDAVSVPGVGPSRADPLSSALCAAPTTLPPAQQHAPAAGFSGIDLQTATAQQIADAGLLPLPVAQRLKAHGPLPDNLHQVATPAVPGLADPTIDKLLASPNVAITPYPFVYGGTTWRWVSHDHGATVAAATDPRYALFVPAGRVTGDGAWATATPQPPSQGVLPSSGFHIYGVWTPEVGVQLPNVDGGAPDSETVIHYAADGPHISNGTGAAPGTVVGSVLVSAASLSDFITSLGQSSCTGPNAAYLTPTSQVWCINNLRDTPLSTAFTSTYAYQAHFAGTSPGPCPIPSNQLLTVHGSMHSMTCTKAQTSGTTGTVSWRNDSGDALHFGNVYRYQGSSSLSLSVDRSDDKGRFTTRLFNDMGDRFDVLPPKDGFTVTVAQGAAPATTQVKTDSSAPLFWAASQFTSALDALSDVTLGDTQVVSCAISLAQDPKELGTFLDCASKAIINAISFVRGTGHLSAADDKALASIAEKANALGAIATGIDVALSGIQWGAEDSWDQATYEFKSPPPVIGGSGADLGTGSPMADGKYIARVGTAAYVVSPATASRAAVAQSITTGPDFNCYATGYFVADNVSTFRSNDNAVHLNLPGLPLVDLGAGAPHCNGTMALTWTYTPPPAGNTPYGIIVKMPDWEGRGSWWITPDGAIETIPDGSTYQCLAAKAPVIFNFPFAKVQAWPTVGSTPARCP